MATRSARRARERRQSEPAPPSRQSPLRLPASRIVAASIGIAVFVLALGLRVQNREHVFVSESVRINPMDEMYHLIRVVQGAREFPRIRAFDPDRGVSGAFSPWPPLYDGMLSLACWMTGNTSREEVLRTIVWIPPLMFSAFAAVLAGVLARKWTAVSGLAAGLFLATAPSFIMQSSLGDVDHHWSEGIVVVLILLAAMALVREETARWRNAALLSLAMLAALLIQSALIVVAGMIFIGLYLLLSDPQRLTAAASAFAIVTVGLLLYRLLMPAGYPNSPWFLGYAHAALTAAAAIALGARAGMVRRAARPLLAWILPLLAGVALPLLIPGTLPLLREGSGFFAGSNVLKTIQEVQPFFEVLPPLTALMFLLPAAVFLALSLSRQARRYVSREFFLLAGITIGLGLLLLSSVRFNSHFFPALALFAAAALEIVLKARPLPWALGAAALLIVPNLFALPRSLSVLRNDPAYFAPFYDAASVIRDRPGRVLTPWETGHLIHYESGRPVVIDNFAFMGIDEQFDRAIAAPLSKTEEEMAAYSRASGVGIILLRNPALWISDSLETLDLPADEYVRDLETAAKFSDLARSTFWWRAYYSTDPSEFRHFRKIWEHPDRLGLPPRYDGSVLQAWEFVP